jgi:hypothetical protein
VLAQKLGIAVDLDRQLAGRCNHDRARIRPRALAAFIQQLAENGQQKGRRLAGAGACLAQHIAAFQGQRQGLGLDRGAEFEVGFGQAAGDFFVEIEGVEPHVREHGFGDLVFGHVKLVP